MKNLLYIAIGAGFLGIISSSASGFLTTETSNTLDNLYEENFYIDPESVEVGDDKVKVLLYQVNTNNCLLYTSPSPRDISGSRMPSSA